VGIDFDDDGEDVDAGEIDECVGKVLHKFVSIQEVNEGCEIFKFGEESEDEPSDKNGETMAAVGSRLRIKVCIGVVFQRKEGFLNHLVEKLEMLWGFEGGEPNSA